jgi:hypothetical protein
VSRRQPLAAAAIVALAGLLAACTDAGAPEPPAPPPPPPPPPPAACLLDTGALATATGLTWTPDASTASDIRCVYDPSGSPRPPEGPAFVAVEVAPAADPNPATALDAVAVLCEDGSRVPAGQAGFVCRFGGDSVFAAAVRDGQVVTLAASGVPAGTTAARLVVAFDQQMAALTR